MERAMQSVKKKEKKEWMEKANAVIKKNAIQSAHKMKCIVLYNLYSYEIM